MTLVCSICDNEIKGDKYGHNASPFMPRRRCCEECNRRVVMPLRAYLIDKGAYRSQGRIPIYKLEDDYKVKANLAKEVRMNIESVVTVAASGKAIELKLSSSTMAALTTLLEGMYKTQQELEDEVSDPA